MSKMFDAFSHGSLHLRNRTVMAPMTRRQSPHGLPTAEVAGYYLRRAQGGVGLIISEGLALDHPTSIQDTTIPNLFDDRAVAAWAQITRDIQQAGAAFMPQLWHIGGARFKYDNVPNPDLPTLSASGIYHPEKVEGQPASEAEIEAVIASYGRAARLAWQMGCDGINIHGGHGYLLDGFFWNRTNLRDDGYGGDLARRTRFACEVVRECRRQTSPDFPIMLRFSQFKEQAYDAQLCTSPHELEQFLAPLTLAGVDIFDCSTRRFWTAEFSGSDLGLAGWTRKLSGKPVMAVGSVGLENDVIAALHRGEASSAATRLDLLERCLDRGDFDLVGIGRALLSDPAWVEKVRDGRTSQLRGFNPADLAILT